MELLIAISIGVAIVFGLPFAAIVVALLTRSRVRRLEHLVDAQEKSIERLQNEVRRQPVEPARRPEPAPDRAPEPRPIAIPAASPPAAAGKSCASSEPRAIEPMP